MLDLSLKAFIQTSLEISLHLLGIDIAEVVEKLFVFAISLIGAIIQDSGIKERSMLEMTESLLAVFIIKNNYCFAFCDELRITNLSINQYTYKEYEYECIIV